jgi:hypothetical protein
MVPDPEGRVPKKRSAFFGVPRIASPSGVHGCECEGDAMRRHYEDAGLKPALQILTMSPKAGAASPSRREYLKKR